MKVLIVGGVAGGATLAARLRRLDENVEIVLFEKGEYVSYANCGLPYYIGGVITDREDLFLHTVESLSTRFRLDIRDMAEVISIDSQNKTVKVHDLKNGKDYIEKYDKLVLSTGADPIRPSLPGIENEGIFTLRNVTDTDKIKSYISDNTPKKAVIIGGGFIGLEMADNLNHAGIETTIIEKTMQVMAPLDYSMASIIHNYLRNLEINLTFGAGVSAFERNGNSIKVILENKEKIDTDMVVLSIGVSPDNKLAKGCGLKIGETGGIHVDEYMQTSDKDIYALGDSVEVFNPVIEKYSLIALAGPANKQARIVADNIVYGNKNKYIGTIGTSIAKIGNLTVAATGASSKLLDKEKIQHITSYTHGSSHASYYPGAHQLSIKINFAPDTGKLLGVQIIGYDGVDKRIDLFSQVIKKNGTIYELQEIEHGYAPPYSSAKDPVNIAGFVAENMLTGKVKAIYWNEIENLDKNNSFLIDTRTVGEFNRGHIGGAVNISLDTIRGKFNEIPKDKKIIIYCAVGLRGYIAARILMQNGYEDVYNLSGGYETYRYAIG
ncbi:MAG: FAD-dependent oxidoreductase [Fusobacteriaceae bacterium]|jgi:NADPH-dependent 2,4-dienoyl-CoA reductase/sulfur reductase-like enzyme/rhodanese-related sulfurtransferase|nr:FAD-dependent oxidoreductase [Fusobacteriaceae bacterium]